MTAKALKTLHIIADIYVEGRVVHMFFKSCLALFLGIGTFFFSFFLLQKKKSIQGKFSNMSIYTKGESRVDY